MNRLNSIQAIISYIALLAPFVPLLVGGIRFRSLSLAQKATVFLLLSFVLISGLNFLLSSLGAKNLLPLYHIFSLVEFFGFVWIFSRPPYKIISPKWSWVLIMQILSVFALNFLMGNSLYQMPVLLRTAESVLLTGMAGYYLVRVFREMKVAKLEKEFLFWLSLAILIMFLGNLLLEITVNQFLDRYDVYYNVWSMKNIRDIIAYPLIAIGLLCKDPQKIL